MNRVFVVAVVLATVAAPAVAAPAVAGPPRPGIELGAGTAVPLAVDVEATLAPTDRLAIELAVGVMPPPYIDLINATVVAFDGYDETTAVESAAPAPATPARPSCESKRTERPASARIDGTALDAQGTPLPKHAIARLGDLRMRSAGWIGHVLFCGGDVISVDEAGFAAAWDSATGARKGRWNTQSRSVMRMQCVDDRARAITAEGDDLELDIATGTTRARASFCEPSWVFSSWRFGFNR